MTILSVLSSTTVQFENPKFFIDHKNNVVFQIHIQNAYNPTIEKLLLNATPINIQLTFESLAVNKIINIDFIYNPLHNLLVIDCEGTNTEMVIKDKNKFKAVLEKIQFILCAKKEFPALKDMEFKLKAIAQIKQKTIEINNIKLWSNNPESLFKINTTL